MNLHNLPKYRDYDNFTLLVAAACSIPKSERAPKYVPNTNSVTFTCSYNYVQMLGKYTHLTIMGVVLPILVETIHVLNPQLVNKRRKRGRGKLPQSIVSRRMPVFIQTT